MRGVAAVEREVVADVSVVFRWAGERDVSVEWPAVWLLVFGWDDAGAGELWLAGLVGAGAGAGGPRGGTVRPGGPLTGSMFPVLCGGSITGVALAGCSPV